MGVTSSAMQNYLAYSEETVDGKFNTSFNPIGDSSGRGLTEINESSLETLVKFKRLIDVVYMKPKPHYNHTFDDSRFQNVYQPDNLSEKKSDEFWDITLVNMLLLSVYEHHKIDAIMMLALSRYIDEGYGRDTMKMIRESLIS